MVNVKQIAYGWFSILNLSKIFLHTKLSNSLILDKILRSLKIRFKSGNNL
jgi:hypothetical protein